MSKIRHRKRSKVNYNHRAGTVGYRFNLFLNQLSKRYQINPFLSSVTPENQYLTALDNERANHKSEVENLHNAINSAIVALDDCTHIYAPEFCDETDVEESRARMSDGGTLWYIASVVQQCRDAKKV